MAIASAYTRYNYAPEDVYLGMTAFKLGVELHNVDSMYDHYHYDLMNKDHQPAMDGVGENEESLVLANPSNRKRRYCQFTAGRARSIISFEELGRLSRRFWKLVRYPEVYRTYPQDVPLNQIIKAVKAGLPVTDMPQYNFPISILKTSTKVCANNTKHDLVIVVKSGNLGWDARTAFREFMQRERARYPKLKVGVVFSLGLPRKRGGRLFNRDGNIISLP
ncbi:unnamed protein product, partial [Mesocestoides corti]